jgi:transcriptional regulator GlxA family with amidase domain
MALSARVARARVELALTYIDAHLDEPLELQTLAALACMSRFHFLRRFKALVGTTPGRYVRQRRAERAADLLAASSGDIDIGNVALACGFASHAHMSTVFRKHFNATPSAFRGKRREPNATVPVCACAVGGRCVRQGEGCATKAQSCESTAHAQ